MKRLARLTEAQLSALEDRFADLLPVRAVDRGHSAVTATVARAWIDLNRSEAELDPALVSDRRLAPRATHMTAKVRGGLGLIPSRLARGGEIWRAPLHSEDVDSRILQVYRPYHDHIAEALEARRRRFGCAVLLDVHSMPTLLPDRRGEPPHIVIGDLHGCSAESRLTNRAVDEARTAGFRVAVNIPYAGGHILERHTRSAKAIHGLQLEVDRKLYLDANFREAGQGLPVIQNLIARIAAALADEALAQPVSIAAE
jgi:N-formylglutamate amidohydrolase